MWFHLNEILEQETLSYDARNQNSVCWWVLTKKGHKGNLWGDGNVLDMRVVYMDVYVGQTQRTVHLRAVSLHVSYTSIKDSKIKNQVHRDGVLVLFLPNHR